MPRIEINGTRLYYEDTGSGDETVFFSHGLLWDGRMFGPQVEALSDRYRCITYDHRGQGRSEVPTESSIPMDLLAADAAALIEALDAAPCHFVGLSMGGFTGMRVAARRPDLVRSLVLMETSARPEEPQNRVKYRLLAQAARLAGTGPLTGQVMPIMFGQTFLDDPSRAPEREQWKTILAGNRKDIYKAVNGVIERGNVEVEVARIEVPTLVMVGEEDVAQPPEESELLASAIPDAKLVRIPRAGHTSTIEEPAFVNQELQQWLETHREA
ncbi:MAG: alpha/beta fold hydrolase [Nitriliruptorales bacterium]|nr:alpha/beta fold hydrolase [Nitriliruptorales bacterium]